MRKTETGQPMEPEGARDTRGSGPRRRLGIVARLKQGYDDLRPAERRVADAVLDDLDFAVEASNTALARRAEVSEPTVTRFCRAIGCDGVRDFKIKLVQALSVEPRPPETPPATRGGDTPPFTGPVFDEARRALHATERQIDPADVQRAADLIARARQVAVFGLGGSSSALAQETQYRLFRYGVPIAAHRDPYLMRMTAATLRPGDLVIALSATGRTPEVIEAVRLAREYGAETLALTAPESALAKAADVGLTVAIPEYPDILKPTASRFVFLTVIDLVSTATGYRLGSPALESLRRIKATMWSHRAGEDPDPLGD